MGLVKRRQNIDMVSCQWKGKRKSGGEKVDRSWSEKKIEVQVWRASAKTLQSWHMSALAGHTSSENE